MSRGAAGATHDLSGLPVGRGRLLAAMLVLLALLLVAVVGSAMSGAVRIPLDAMPALLGVASDSVSTSSAAGRPEYRLWEGVLMDIRLPRILLGMLAGAALAVAGAVMQALFRNPLAEPGLVGVSVGGAVGAVGAIVLGYDQQPLVLAGAAFAGGLLATLAAWALGSLSAALVYGSRTWAWPMWRQFLVGVLALALGASTFILAGSVPVLMVLMLVTGMSIAPTVTVGNHIVQAVTPRDQLTEGLTWVGTAMNVGVSLGSLLAGRLVDTHGSRGGYVLVTVFAWLSVLVALATIGVVRQARVHHHLPEA